MTWKIFNWLSMKDELEKIEKIKDKLADVHHVEDIPDDIFDDKSLTFGHLGRVLTVIACDLREIALAGRTKLEKKSKKKRASRKR